MGAALAGYHPGLANKPIMRVEGACASGGLAIQCASDAVKAGSDIVLGFVSPPTLVSLDSLMDFLLFSGRGRGANNQECQGWRRLFGTRL